MTVSFNPKAFGSECATLIASVDTCELGPGSPNRAVSNQLQSLDEAAIFGEQTVVDHDMASCCISGLWLLHDFLDDSHEISQEIHTMNNLRGFPIYTIDITVLRPSSQVCIIV